MAEGPRFRDPTWPARIAIALLAVHGFVALVLSLSIAFRTWIVESDALYAAEDAIATPLQLVYLLTAIAFLTWFYRVHANLTALGGTPTRASHFAVGCWFIPIGGLWLPCQVASEIWRESAGPPSHDPAAPPRDRGGAVVIAWWTFFLARGFVSAAVGFARHGSDFETVNAMAIGANVITLTAAALAIVLVLRVTRRQLDTAAGSAPLVF